MKNLGVEENVVTYPVKRANGEVKAAATGADSQTNWKVPMKSLRHMRLGRSPEFHEAGTVAARSGGGPEMQPVGSVIDTVERIMRNPFDNQLQTYSKKVKGVMDLAGRRKARAEHAVWTARAFMGESHLLFLEFPHEFGFARAFASRAAHT